MKINLSFILSLSENKIHIFNADDKEYTGDTDIFGDGVLIYKIENDNFPLLPSRRWHKPSISLLDIKELKVVLKIKDYSNKDKINKDILKILDPYGEDNWTEPDIITIEKKWKINVNIEEMN